MAKLTTPIPPDKIGESFVWRDWFQRLSDKVFGTMAQQDASSVSITGGSISGIDLNGNNISNARITNSFIESTTIGLNNPSAGSFTSIILGTPLAISYGGTNSTSTPTAGAVPYGTGTAYAFTAAGTVGQVLTSNGAGVPTWTTPTTGTVTSVSVVSSNGFAGTSSGGATPALTLSTTITGLLKGNGTAISAATNNTDYMGIAAPVTKTADFTVATGDIWHINNKSGSTCVVTLPTASSWTGRTLTFKNMQAQLLDSATSNVVPLDSTTAGTAILLGVVGNWATLVSDGTNWVIMQAASNNNLLLE